MQTIPVSAKVRLALLPGSFHPITKAHLALARAALAFADQLWFVLPRSFPHKSYDQVSLRDRVDLIRAAIDDPRMAAVISEGGLFIEMVRECRRRFPTLGQISVVCGRDAAERIIAWDYDGVAPIEEQLREYNLLVAARNGDLDPPPHLAPHIHTLRLAEDYNNISATALREKIRQGADWKDHTPAAIHDRVLSLYG
jgi:nicotinic acid mononucleotide adenylyltransferase